jgi:hypothetical protein
VSVRGGLLLSLDVYMNDETLYLYRFRIVGIIMIFNQILFKIFGRLDEWLRRSTK